MHFYTSVNMNYLPKARILAKSIKEYCQNSKFTVVLSDELPNDINIKNEYFDEIITVRELNIPVDNLDLWMFKHTVVELCTAVKGQALVNFLESGSEKVVYLDPDTVVYDSLNELEYMMDVHDIILTPHQTIPEKSKEDIIDNEICSLKHGIYNFGFYAVSNSKNGLEFARWWRDRLLHFCFDDIPNGLFTDQRWGDLVPAMFEGVHVLKDPGYNVSTWNLSNRFVTKNEDGKYLVNNVPLKFYHFSGFDSGAQEVMLKKFAKGNKHLFEMREWYISRMRDEEQDKYSSYPSKYNFYSNNEKIEKHQREILRNRLDVINYFKDTNPYVVNQEKSYYFWYKDEFGDQYQVNSEEERELNYLKMELRNIYNSRSYKIVQKIKRVLGR